MLQWKHLTGFHFTLSWQDGSISPGGCCLLTSYLQCRDTDNFYLKIECMINHHLGTCSISLWFQEKWQSTDSMLRHRLQRTLAWYNVLWQTGLFKYINTYYTIHPIKVVRCCVSEVWGIKCWMGDIHRAGKQCNRPTCSHYVCYFVLMQSEL